MATETTYSGKKGGWQKLLKTLEGNAELAYLETQQTKLSNLLSQAVEVTKQQHALKASKQELSQQLQTIMSEGERTATLLRKSIQGHYGIRSEKLTEFGLKPFRGLPFRPRIRKPRTTETPGSSGSSTSTPSA